ncbi:hypothetical protein OAA09_00590 [bacterium]|nr:hypothetical protein [bacterium]
MSNNNNHDDDYIPEFQFDKFMNDIVKREDAAREHIKDYAEGHAELPQRKYNKLYRELPQNRVVYRPKNKKD